MAASMSDQLETKLNQVFEKNAPKLPESGKKALVEWAPWVALAAGILTWVAAYGLWTWAHVASGLLSYINSVCTVYGDSNCSSPTDNMTLWVWLGVIFLAVEGALYLLAFPGLRDRKKTGWNYLYWGALVGLIYTVISLFTGYGIMNVVVSLLGSAVGLWLLFQVRGMYMHERVAKAHAGK